LKQPTDPAQLEVLKGNNVTSKSGWDRWARFLVFVAATYGRYGRDIYPAQGTMATEFGAGCSRQTIGRWLAAAVGLGLLRVVREATRDDAAVYEIVPFWLDRESPTVPDPWAMPATGVQDTPDPEHHLVTGNW
jgi:hypothetical protein